MPLSAATPNSSLSPRRLLALREYLRNGGNLSLTGKAVGVSRQTIKKWSLSKAWRDAESKALASILPAPQKVRPRKLFQRALARLEHDLATGDEATKSDVAKIIFSRLSSWMLQQDGERKINELAQRLTRLQAIVESGKKTLPHSNQTKNIKERFVFDDDGDES